MVIKASSEISDRSFTGNTATETGVYINVIKRSRLRAVIRLLLLAAVTSFHIIRSLIKRLFIIQLPGKEVPGFGARILREWASSCNRRLKLDVTVMGEPPVEGTLLVSNHRSYMDITAIGESVPLTFLAKKEVRSWPLLGYGCVCTDVVFVDRQDKASRKKARTDIEKLLARGVSIVVFPEGTSFEGPGALPFRPGVFILATEHDFPVVPVAVQYEDVTDAWVGNDTFFPHFLKAFAKPKVSLTVAFGPRMKGKDPEKLKAKAHKWVDTTLKKLKKKYEQRN